MFAESHCALVLIGRGQVGPFGAVHFMLLYRETLCTNLYVNHWFKVPYSETIVKNVSDFGCFFMCDSLIVWL